MKNFEVKESLRTKPGPDKGMSALLGGSSASPTRLSKGKTLSTSVVCACSEIGLSILALCFFKMLGRDRVQHKKRHLLRLEHHHL